MATPNRVLNGEDPSNQFVTHSRTELDHAVFARKRNALDSWHDNPASMNHAIIRRLYSGGIDGSGQRPVPFKTEGEFVTFVMANQGVPASYFLRWADRLAESYAFNLTPKMECLVNDAPFEPFAGVPNYELTFPYDQGPGLLNYMRGAVNCLFISDAIDTAPKKTGKQYKPYYFPIDLVIMSGKDVGFDESVIKQVAFADFRASPIGESRQVECKALILADPGGSGQFRWYDLNNTDTRERPTDLAAARASAIPKRSNYPSGFFAGNDAGARVLDTADLKPVIALCTVAAKVLSDISVAISASPQVQKLYPLPGAAGWLPLYDGQDTIVAPSKYIHNTGDRTSSIEGSRLGADTCYVSPMSKGIAVGRFIPGEEVQGGEATVAAFLGRLDTIKTEINDRFVAFVADLTPDSEKYRVDGVAMINNESRTAALATYLDGKKTQIEAWKADVNDFLDKKIAEIKAAAATGEIDARIATAKEGFQGLEKRKLSLMPQSPTISATLKNGERKSLPGSFFVCATQDGRKQQIAFKTDIDGLVRAVRGGRRRTVRRRRSLRRMRGGNPICIAFETFTEAIRDAAIDASMGVLVTDETSLLDAFKVAFPGDPNTALEAIKGCREYDEDLWWSVFNEVEYEEINARFDTDAVSNAIVAALVDPPAPTAAPPAPEPVPPPAAESGYGTDSTIVGPSHVRIGPKAIAVRNLAASKIASQAERMGTIREKQRTAATNTLRGLAGAPMKDIVAGRRTFRRRLPKLL